MLKGNKYVVVKNLGHLLEIGDIVEVTDVNEEVIVFAFGEELEHTGFVGVDCFEDYFEEFEQEEYLIAPKVTEDRIRQITDGTELNVMTVFDKCTIVAAKLPNGYVIVESSACVSPENYDKDMGINICVDKIIDRVYELEAYKLQNELYSCEDEDGEVCPFICEDCDDCFYN